MTLQNDWNFWLTSLAIVAVFGGLIYLAWWALFADRRNRHRRRCPRCWYDLAYSPGMTCGECGFTAWSERQFHQIRRRYRVALAAILACVAMAVIINERATGSWASALPTRVLVVLMPLSHSPSSSISRELTTRAAMQKLSASDWTAIISRCAAGDFAARPTSDSWRGKYGNFILQWRQVLSNDSKLAATLNQIPPRIDITARTTWPAGMPVVVQVDVQDWWASGMECRIRATPSIGGQKIAEPRTFYRTGDDRIPRRGFPLTLPPLPVGTSNVQIELDIDRRPMSAAASAGSDNEWQPAAKQSITLNLRGLPSDRPPLIAMEDPRMDAQIGQVFNAGVVKWVGGPSPLRVRVNQPATFIPLFDDVALGLRVDVLCDGQVARRLNLWWLGGGGSGNVLERHYGFDIAIENVDLLSKANSDDGRWQLRITGDPSLALRAAGGKNYWAGEFVLPLWVQVQTTTAPPKAWWTEEE